MANTRAYMDDLSLAARILKSLIAPARHSDGPTVYVICQLDGQEGCVIYEQLPDGRCLAWPEPPSSGLQQSEGAIDQRTQPKK